MAGIFNGTDDHFYLPALVRGFSKGTAAGTPIKTLEVK